MAAAQPFGILRQTFVGGVALAEKKVTFQREGQDGVVEVTGNTTQLRPGRYWCSIAGRGQWIEVATTLQAGTFLHHLIDPSIARI